MFSDKKPFFYYENYDEIGSCYSDINLLTQDNKKILTENDFSLYINIDIICDYFKDVVVRDQRYIEILTEDNRKIYA